MVLEYFARRVLTLVMVTLLCQVIAGIPHLNANAINHSYQDFVAGWIGLFALCVLWPFVSSGSALVGQPLHRKLAHKTGSNAESRPIRDRGGGGADAGRKEKA